jgi:hypothetical protein
MGRTQLAFADHRYGENTLGGWQRYWIDGSPGAFTQPEPPTRKE